jgi:hypothetical protein
MDSQVKLFRDVAVPLAFCVMGGVLSWVHIRRADYVPESVVRGISLAFCLCGGWRKGYIKGVRGQEFQIKQTIYTERDAVVLGWITIIICTGLSVFLVFA